MRKLLTLLPALILSTVLAVAQPKPVTGKITDQQGQPVQYGSVRIKGTKIGTTAEANGNSTIKAAVGQTLIFSGAGLTAKEVVVSDAFPATITVTRAENNMTEVVVTALGVKRQPRQLGYSTAVVTAKDINEASVTNVVSGLSGKVSGVDIRLADNSVNPNIQVTFRGDRSIAGNNQALVVLDGIIIDQSYLA